ncbi:MAG: sigma-54-dependent Fis family transcriptional regulator [Elusimicrobia bacterium]|nr:sigma-54-dependent Fis family transcriptional regulator [Elusimicrobiota bacterium]
MDAPLSVLVVEDDALARKVLAAHLAPHRADPAPDAETARRKLASGRYDIAFIDLQLDASGGYAGLELIKPASAKGIYTVVMSGHDSEKCVERAYELGCDDFYAKGNEQDNVGRVLARFLESRDGARRERLFTERFVTGDADTRAAVLAALEYAPSELPILLLGPSGTGKTSLARVIHDHSGRKGGFVAINCSAYTEDLLEAELFGYRKGAFTGAGESRKGKLLLADQGTLFLDEIGAMSLKMQTKLLKAIEERSFYPLGCDRPETSQFRLVSATLEDLHGLIKGGRLRFDFFQRIHGFTLKLKPLAQRPCDILPLVAFFTKGARRLSFSAEAKARLLACPWPGNIRELKKFVDLLEAGHEGRVGPEAVERLLAALRVEQGPEGFASDEQYRFALSRGLNEAVDRFIDVLIQRSLSDNGGKKTKVLDDMKICTRLLYTSLARSGRPPQPKEAKDERELEEVA